MRGIRSLQRQRGLAVLGSLCLVLQLAVWSPLLPLATALIAWMDGGHTIRFVASGDETHVELRHERGVVGQKIVHHHTPLIRSLVCFSKPSNSGEADHILAFSTIGSVSESRSLVQRTTRAEAGLDKGHARAALAALSLRESMQLLAGVHPGRSLGLPESVFLHASTRSLAVELAGTVVLTI
jgi:hypothetical protein